MVPKQFKDTDLKVFIGVASKDGGIKYHETDLSYAYWRHRMNKACTSAGLDRITFSRFRNSLSLALIQTGVPTNAHQQMLGHSAKTALEHYAITNDDDIKAAFQLVQEKLASDDGGG